MYRVDRMVENFLPSVLARYRQQILFPVLRLLVAVLMSFGPDNEYAVNQVGVTRSSLPPAQ